jgi:Flp pilus assembly protein TadG
MLLSHRACRRRGATVVEFAFVAPVALLILFAQIIGGAGVSRYQELAHLARDAARYASTHGGLYQQEGIAQKTGVATVFSANDLKSFLASKAVLLSPDKMEISVSWTAPSTLTPINMPTFVDTNPNLVPPCQTVIQNYVIVTLKYKWFPEAYLTGPITLTSTSEMPMSY